MKVSCLPIGGDRPIAKDPGITGGNTAPKWVMKKVVGVEWEIVRAEKAGVIGVGKAIEAAWDAGCIMAVEKVGLRSAHNPEQQ